MELLTNAGTPKVHGSVTPRKIVERLRLGEAIAPNETPRRGIKTAEVLDAFFSFLEPHVSIRLRRCGKLSHAVSSRASLPTLAVTSRVSVLTVAINSRGRKWFSVVVSLRTRSTLSLVSS